MGDLLFLRQVVGARFVYCGRLWEYAAHYNGARPYRTLGLQSLTGPPRHRRTRSPLERC